MTKTVSNGKPWKLPGDLLTMEMVYDTLSRSGFIENQSAMLSGYSDSKILDVTSVSLQLIRKKKKGSITTVNTNIKWKTYPISKGTEIKLTYSKEIRSLGNKSKTRWKIRSFSHTWKADSFIKIACLCFFWFLPWPTSTPGDGQLSDSLEFHY